MHDDARYAVARKWLIAMLRAQSLWIAAVVAVGILGAMAGVAGIAALHRFIDAIASGATDAAMTYLGGFAVAAFAGLALARVRLTLRIALDRRLTGVASSDLLSILFGGSARDGDHLQTGAVVARLQECGRVLSQATEVAVRGSSELLFFLLAIGYAFVTSVPLTLVALGSFPIAYGVARLGTRFVTRPNEALLAAQETYNTGLISGLETRLDARSWGLAAPVRDGLIERLRTVVDAGARVRRISGDLRLATTGVQRGAEILVLLVGTFEVARGALTPGGLLAFFFLLVRIGNPLTMLAGLSEAWRQTGIVLVRVGALLAEPTPDAPGPSLVALGPGEIAATRPDGRVLAHLRPGDRVKVTGPVGVGKSSLLHVLAGRAGPMPGVRALGPGIGGDDIVHLGPRPFLFAASLLDNLRGGARAATAGDVRTTAAAMGLESVLASRWDALADPLDPAVPCLSAGEAQAVALVRLALSGKRVAILDEATCHLEPDAEARALDWLARRDDADILVVAGHRLDTLDVFTRTIALGRSDRDRCVPEGGTDHART
ncbi:ATP-binding cassette domain-containing protein [Salinarimonas sp.]|uniref:ATP-binding cassette domain-containing protein n=1 Tax=Salinarimonas sp. TaxID=2766526 RepID=UPI0032D8EE82